LNGIPNFFKRAFALLSSDAVVTIVIFIPFVVSTLLKSISGKIRKLLIPKE
jgi:hypothetical protein